MKKITAIVLLWLITSFAYCNVFAETLTISAPTTVLEGATDVLVNINVDTGINTAGASFTLTYDTTKLSLNGVSSTYFDTFSSAVVVGDPPNEETYNQALVYNETSAGVMLAGASINEGSAGTQTLFTLSFNVIGSAGDVVNFNIVNSYIDNALAGYDPPAYIPMIVGIDGTDPGPYTYPAIQTASVTPASISIQPACTDCDNDGLLDAWEEQHFGDTTSYTALDDPDKDGYTNGTEEDNGTNPGTPDASGGPGYNDLTDKDWFMLDESDAQSIIPFRDGIVADFGTNGLFYFDGTSWTNIHALDAGVMAAGDIDSDGTEELVVFFQGYGIYSWDGSWGGLITSIEPEGMVTFGNSIAIDFGATYGLYTYDSTSSFVQIHSLDPSMMTEADVDNDGAMELTVYFSSYGIYVYDNGTWGAPITSIAPEQISRFGKGIAIDFGTSYGLYTYQSGSFTQINSIDPTQLVEVDIDGDGTMELAAYLSGYGVYIYDSGEWGAQITAFQPDKLIGVNNTLVMDLASEGIYTYSVSKGLTKLTSQNVAIMVAQGSELYCTFTSSGMFYYSIAAEEIKVLADTLVMNLPSYGLYTYSSAGGFTNLLSLQAPKSVTADIDSDGTDEILAYVQGHGLYVFDNGSWGAQITNIEPESMIRFGNSVALDFGATYGLYTYDTASGFQQLLAIDPSHMVEADVDSDGTMELAVYLSGYGIFIYDGAWSSAITSIEPEQIVAFGNGIAIDFGATYGLYTYDTLSGFIKILSLDSSLMQQADIDSDGVKELAVSFAGYGVYIYDSGSWSAAVTTVEPEAMVEFGSSLILDFGSTYGLYSYDTANGFSLMHSLDSSHQTVADVDNDGALELTAVFSGYGIYVYDGSWSSSPITTVIPDMMTSGNLQ